VEAFVFRDTELHDFLLKAFPKRLGNTDTLMGWCSKATVAFPDVDLVKEARKALLWEAERPSRTKKDVRAFLRNWWSRSQENFEAGGAKVVPIAAVKWLRKNNKSPDYLLDRWCAKRGGLTRESIASFCQYFAIAPPLSADEVIEVRGSES
jgi:hypothetical protein